MGQTPNTVFVFNKGDINKGNLTNVVRPFFLSDLITFPVTFAARVATLCRAVVIICFAYVSIQKLCVLSTQRNCF